MSRIQMPVCIYCETDQFVKEYLIAPHDPPHTYYKCVDCGIIFEDPELYLSNEFDFSKPVEDITEEEKKIFQRHFIEVIDISDTDGNLYPNYDYTENQMALGLFNRIDNTIKSLTGFDHVHGFRILEIGCASGFLLKQFKSMYPNCDIVGVEYNG